MSHNNLCIKGILATLLVATTLGAPSSTAEAEVVPPTQASAPTQADFGPSVLIFDPNMPTGEIQAQVDAIAAQQVDNEMGTERYTLLFRPGTYGSAANPLVIQVGYYTEVAGLGATPTDVTINGHVDVYNRCLTSDTCFALTNFWRSLSNLTIKVMGLSDCRTAATSGLFRKHLPCDASKSLAATFYSWTIALRDHVLPAVDSLRTPNWASSLTEPSSSSLCGTASSA